LLLAVIGNHPRRDWHHDLAAQKTASRVKVRGGTNKEGM
jgi:hypothetical protein